MATICMAGLGIIGGVWARHYAADGHQVAAWNRTPKPDFPGFVPDLTRAACDADLVHICVADPAAVRGVLETLLPILQPGRLVVQSSTICPDSAESFRAMVESTGALYVEAPFTGSKPAAEARQSVFFLGGDPAALDAATPFLTGLSRKIFRIGTPAQSAAVKLALNLQIAAIAQSLCEGVHLSRKFHIPHDLFFDVLRENVAHSGLADLKEPKLRDRDHSPQFSIKHMYKDLGLALEASRGLDMPLTRTNRSIYEQGIDAGLGELDFIALEQLITDE